MSDTSSWSTEETAQLKRMRGDGIAASAIAAKLGRSRSAVLGKCHREGLSLTGVNGGLKAMESRKRARATAKAKAEASREKSEPWTTPPAKPVSAPAANSTLVRQIAKARDAGPGGGADTRGAADGLVSLPAAKETAAAYDAARLVEAVRLADLDSCGCRFPVSPHGVAASEHLFCAAPVADRFASPLNARRSYCRHHVARVISRDGRAGHGSISHE